MYYIFFKSDFPRLPLLTIGLKFTGPNWVILSSKIRDYSSQSLFLNFSIELKTQLATLPISVFSTYLGKWWLKNKNWNLIDCPVIILLLSFEAPAWAVIILCSHKKEHQCSECVLPCGRIRGSSISVNSLGSRIFYLCSWDPSMFFWHTGHAQ